MESVAFWHAIGMLAAALNLSVAFLVYLRDKHVGHRSFAILSLLLSLWNVCHVKVYPDYADQTWMRLLFSTLAFVPLFAYRFAYGYLSAERKPGVLDKPLALMGAGFLATTWTPIFFANEWKIALTCFAFPILGYCLLLFLRAWAAAKDPARRNSLTYLIAGSALAIAGGLAEFLPRFGVAIPKFPFGSSTMMLYTLAVAYAIQRHHLMDLASVVKKGAVLAFGAAATGLAAVLLDAAARHIPGPRWGGLLLTVYAVLTLTMLVWGLCADRLREIFAQEDFERERALESYMSALTSLVDWTAMAEATAKLLMSQLSCEKTLVEVPPARRPALPAPAWKVFFSRSPGPVTARQLEVDLKLGRLAQPAAGAAAAMSEFMNGSGLEAAAPILREHEPIGVLGLGPRVSGFYDMAALGWTARVAAALSQGAETSRVHRELVHSDRLVHLGIISAGIAHEIRNPLNYLMTAMELLRAEDIDPPRRTRMMEGVQQELNRMKGLVQDVLSYAQPRAPQLKPCEVGATVNELYEILRPTFSMKVDLRWTRPAEPIRAMLDPDHLKQILLNLVRNAQLAFEAAGKPGTVTLSASRLGDRLVVQVADNGTGIPAEQVALLFQPFSSGSEGGTGLGLAIVERLVQLHHGQIWVSSQLGVGTIFTMEFPALQDESAA